MRHSSHHSRSPPVGALFLHTACFRFSTLESRRVLALLSGTYLPTFHPPQVRRELHDSMPPRPTRLLLGELTDNQRAVVMTLMTGCCAVIGFMVQNKLDERWGGLQEVRTPPLRFLLLLCAVC